MTKKQQALLEIREINQNLLTAFIVLKLVNYITWSWIWVLSPLWIPLSIFVIASLFDKEEEPS